MQTYLKTHLHEYKNFLQAHATAIRNYIAYDMELGTVFDELMVLTCSRVLNINIAIIAGNGLKPQIFKQLSPLKTLCLGQLDKDYYSLKENKDLPRLKFLHEYIEVEEMEPPDDENVSVVRIRLGHDVMAGFPN